jgi:HEAT repeat protein
LGEALTDEDPLVRRVAAESLGKIGPPASAAVPALIAMLQTEDRLQAVKALIRFKTAARDAAPALIATLKDSSPEVRWNACEALGDMQAKAAIPALEELLADPEAKVREHAAEALSEIGSDARAAVPTLRRLLADPDAGVRDEAIKALKRIDPSSPVARPGKKTD